MKRQSAILLSLLMVLFIVAGILIIKSLTIGRMNVVKIEKDDESLGISSRDEIQSTQTSTEALLSGSFNKPSVKQEVYVDKGGVVNIAVLGIDSRYPDDKGRSDAIMIVSIDYDRKKIKISSLMRDLKVSIEGRGEDKLNHAYAYGGGLLTIKTINQNFGLDVRNFVTTNFYSLEKIVDLMGGIELDITEAERKEINYRVREVAEVSKKSSYETLENIGIQVLNGEQSVAYARIRSTVGGDYKRTERQRIVLSALIDKAEQMSIQDLFRLSGKVFPMIFTSLEEKEVFNLLIRYFKLGANFEVEMARFPQDGEFRSDMSTGVYYMVPISKEGLKKSIGDFIYNDSSINTP